MTADRLGRSAPADLKGPTRGLPSIDDLADTFCFLRRHDHVEESHCEASWIEADRVVRALSARYDFRAGR